MEFPELGKHCLEPTCKQLDFLPLKCDACEKIFCKDHITYILHHCTSAYKKDVQVPVCPLCNIPIPVTRGQTPDIVVGDHIDRDCKSDPALQKRKIFTNRCGKSGCKQKELMKVICNDCRGNFCLKHRHPLDHDCKGNTAPVSRAGNAALMRSQASSSKTPTSYSSFAAPRPAAQPQRNRRRKRLCRELWKCRSQRLQPTPLSRTARRMRTWRWLEPYRPVRRSTGGSMRGKTAMPNRAAAACPST
uniref:Zinc finger AN1-type containing 2B n=1 Tax=Leptobrachium leishanense TaxID=445787 RepID=A0A8C5QRL2_9ANUR